MLHLLRVGLVVLALLIAAQPTGASNGTEQENRDGVAQAQEAARDQAAGLAVEKVVDTTAAGDSFSAAFLANRLLGGSPEDAAEAGHRLASQVIQVPGALIPR